MPAESIITPRWVSIHAVTLLFCFCMAACKKGKDSIIDSIVKYGRYEGMYPGISDKVSPQWKNYEALIKNFSLKELTELCNHNNPVVRCYAFKALIEKGSPDIYTILIQHLSDSDEFESVRGCLIDQDRVVDNLLDQVGYNKKRTSDFKLTEPQYAHIDSILLFSDVIKKRSFLGSAYRSGRYTLERIEPKPEFYARIREIVNSGVVEALPLLAQYKRPEDIDVFEQALLCEEHSNSGRSKRIYARSSVKYFPHPSFYPILKNQLKAEIGTNAIFGGVESYTLYLALVQYPQRDTRVLFETALKRSGGEYKVRAEYISMAIKKYPSKIFDGMVIEIPN